MESISPEPSPETLQVSKLDYWARMEAVDQRIMTSVRVPVHELPPHKLQHELADKPMEIKLVRLHEWAVERYQELNERYAASDDEVEWSEGQSNLMEEYRNLLLGLDMLTAEDYEIFNECFENDELFRARFSSSSPDAMHWSPIEE